MSIIHSSVFLVIKKFPEHKGVIHRLSECDDEFLALCEDYRICKEALEYWDVSDSEKAPDRSSEYRSLLKELENEILVNMKNFKETGVL